MVGSAALAGLISLAARRFGERPAVEGDAGVRTYAELDRRSDALASWLASVVPSGARAGVVLPNCAEWVEAFAAAQKAGVPLVPLHPRTGPRELRHVAREARIGAWIHAGEHGLVPGAVELTVGDAYEEALVGHGGEPPEPRPTPESLVVYTSGSTANPRGVRLSAANLMAVTATNDVLAPMTADDRVLLFTPLAHRVASTRMIHALVSGATIVLMAGYDAQRLADTIRGGSISVLATVPTALRDLVGLAGTSGLAPLPSLRHVLMSGEPLTVPLAALRALFPNARIVSFYASTETGPVLWLDDRDMAARPGQAGRALPGVELRFVDEALADVAPGEPGELLVRAGDPGEWYAALGYVDGGFRAEEGWLRTGDVAVRGPDGYVAIVDRKKDMILSGGMNISSREVEEIVGQCPGVAEVAVVGVPDKRYGERVVAFAVQSPAGTDLTERRIIDFVAGEAAGYKKPSEVLFVDRLPRAAAGKIDKRALRERYAKGAGWGS